jgi:hypothetical protein
MGVSCGPRRWNKKNEKESLRKTYERKKKLAPGVAHSRVQRHADRIRSLTDVPVTNFTGEVKIHKAIYMDSVKHPCFLYKNLNISKIGSASVFKWRG